MDARSVVFKNRGLLLAAPAVLLVVFGKPSPLSVLLGLPIALAGEALRCWAVGYSGTTTRDASVTAAELVTAGPYAYVRNPLYVGNFLTACGFALAFTGNSSPSMRAALLTVCLGTMLAVYATIVPYEERYLKERFGTRYDDYAARVPRAFPLLVASRPQHGTYDPGVISRAESRTFVTFGIMLAVLALKAVV